MARQTLVVDASVAVKWFSAKGEDSLSQALAIRDALIDGSLQVAVPELLFYEVSNALVHKTQIPAEAIAAAVRDLMALGLETTGADVGLLESSVGQARKAGITVYDACYLALAMRLDCPLVTANPRHQRHEFGCEVMPLAEWRPPE